MIGRINMKGIGINGYGTIGKRVADAVTAQDDMKIVGITKRTPDFEAKTAVEKGYDLYISVPEREEQFEEAGIKVSGTADELFEKCKKNIIRRKRCYTCNRLKKRAVRGNVQTN